MNDSDHASKSTVVEIGKPCCGNTGEWGRIIVHEVQGPLGPIPLAEWESLPEPGEGPES